MAKKQCTKTYFKRKKLMQETNEIQERGFLLSAEQSGYYFVDFERTDKSLNSRNDFERSSVNAVYCYAFDINKIKTI